MERAADLLLKIAIEINEQVAAGDQVHPGEGRISEHAVECKHGPVAQLSLYVIMVSFPREEAIEPILADVGFDACRIAPLSGGSNRAVIKVGAENLNSRPDVAVGYFFQQQNAD